MQRKSNNTNVTEPTAADDEQLALLVLSRRLGSYRNRSAAAGTERISKLLAHVAAVEVPTEDGTLPAIAPDLLGRKWPVAKTALKRLGCTQPEVGEMYEEAVNHRGAFATLDPEVVEAFFPRELWPVVARMPWEGPGVTSQRLTRALRLYGKTPLAGNRHRPDGVGPARSTINGLREDGRALLRTFVALRVDGHACPGLEPWVAVPKVSVPDLGRRGIERPTPRPEQVRLAISKLDAEIRERLGAREGDDEIDLLERMSPSRVTMSRAFRPMRDRAMLILLSLAGRVTATAELMKSDYVRDHKGVAPDLRHGPAIRLRPGKSLDRDHVRWKPIPPAAARKLDAYLLVLEKGFATRERIAKNEERNGRKPSGLAEPPDDYPLLVSDALHFRPWQAHGIRDRCTGKLPKGKRRGVAPLIVCDEVANADLAPELRPYVGYSPHAFRHLAEQMAERAGRIWNEEHPETGGAAQPEPGLYASALLDHQPKGDPLRALYGDRGTEAAYETLSGRAIAVIWELLTTDRGSRRRPDLVAIRREAEKLRALDGHLQRNEEAFARIQAEGTMPLPAKRIFEEPPRGASLERIMRMTHAVCVSAAESQDLAHERLDRFEVTVRKLLGLMTASTAIRSRREETALRLSKLVYDQRCWEVVADSEPTGAEQVEIDLPALLAGGELIAAPRPELEASSAVRDWLTPPELAECCGIDNRSTVSRWIKGSNLPSVPEHRPWETGAVPVDRSQGKTRCRIWVPGIRDSFWPTSGSRELVAEKLRHWPESQLWTTGPKPKQCCHAPLALPEPFASQLARESGRER